jgi:lipoprotein-releasing system permease protein
MTTIFWLAQGLGLVATIWFGRELFRRKFERGIAMRYLYGGKRDRMMLAAAATSGLIALAGVFDLVLSHGTSPYGVIALIVGMIATAVFTLLALFTVITSVSVFGVMLGVAALTTVLAVTTGFQEQFRNKVLGVNAHVIVMKSQSTFAEYRDVMKTAKAIDPDVIAVQPFNFNEMLATRGKGELSGVAIKGVDPKLVRGVLDLESHMVAGSIDSLAKEPGPGELPPIILGRELAQKLKAKMGDEVIVVVPLSNIDFDSLRASTSAPRTRRFRITGIFYAGFDEYDRRLMYTSLYDSQELNGRGDQVMGVEMKVKDVDRASEISEKLEHALGGPPFQVQDWYDLNHNLFTALNLQKLALVIILTLIILVAAVNVVSTLTMMVTDKTREIAILKSMGSDSTSTARVFQFLGSGIGAVGTFIGLAIGLVTCYVVSAYGYHLDPKVYLIDRLPIDVRPIEVIVVCEISMAISLIAAWVPAQVAAALTPVEGLRYD